MPRPERLDQGGRGAVRVGAAAQKNVDGGEARFRPSVDAHVAFREQRDARNAASAAETVEPHLDHGRAGRSAGGPQRALDSRRVVKPLGALEVDKQVPPAAPPPARRRVRHEKSPRRLSIAPL